MRRVVVDTNLLVLLIVGTLDIQLVGKHRRTRKYSPEDFLLLLQVLERFQTVVLTPHVLTEASNLLRQTDDHRRPLLMTTLAQQIRQAEERSVASERIAGADSFTLLGLTDAVLASELTEDMCVLTDDLDLFRTLLVADRKTCNFTYVRTGAVPLEQV